MKPIIMALSLLLAIATAAVGADWNSRLPSGISDAVRTRIADAIRAGIDPDAAITLTRRMEESRFAEGHMVRAYEIIIAAQREGLPISPIVNKAYEGMAKRVEPERIVPALEAVRSRYAISFQQARALTAEEKQRQALGQTIAEGLTAGIQERDLARITERVRQQTRPFNREQANAFSLLSFQVVRDMARFGVLSGTVTDVVCGALQNRYTAREMERMRNIFINEARYAKAETVARQFFVQIEAGSRAKGLGLDTVEGGLAEGRGGGGSGASASAGGNSGGGGGGSGGGGAGGGGGGGGY